MTSKDICGYIELLISYLEEKVKHLDVVLGIIDNESEALKIEALIEEGKKIKTSKPDVFLEEKFLRKLISALIIVEFKPLDKTLITYIIIDALKCIQ